MQRVSMETVTKRLSFILPVRQSAEFRGGKLSFWRFEQSTSDSVNRIRGACQKQTRSGSLVFADRNIDHPRFDNETLGPVDGGRLACAKPTGRPNALILFII